MMMQEGEVEEEIGDAFDFGLLQDEEDVRAHSTRAEDFNFSELIYKQQQTKRAKQLNFSKFNLLQLCTAPPDKLTLSPPRHRPTQRSISSPSFQEPTKQKLSYKDR